MTTRTKVVVMLVAPLAIIGTAVLTAQQTAHNAASPAAQGPCDIYAAAGDPCVAAHSTTRALYAAYNGPLYEVQRTSDHTTLDIRTLTAGGVANAAAQDAFCANSVCYISKIYDQSGKGNHLTQAGIFTPYPNRGTRPGGGDNLAIATQAPITILGQKAYGVYTIPGMGYRKTNAIGTATGNQAEGMYAVLDGTHYTEGCCFDYGNAEQFAGNEQIFVGEMETIYFGSNTSWGRGAGNGPWIKADLELGVYAGGVSIPTPVLSSPSLTWRFLTAMVDGSGQNRWDIRGGNAQAGPLATFWDGVRPPAYDGSCGRSDKKPPCEYYPMQLEGGIVLGTGGMNDAGGGGTFYEGAMTVGYPSEATAQAVQANIVAARYNLPQLTLSPVKTFTPGSPQTVAAAFTNYTGQAISGVSVSLAAPKGWSVKQRSSGTTSLAAGQTVTTSFTVVAPPTPGTGTLDGTVTWANAGGSKGSASATDSVRSAYPVKINEVGVSAGSFIELYNAGATPVDISGWSLSYAGNGVGDTKVAAIPAGTKIASDGYYLLGGTGYTGPPAANQSFSTAIATMGSLALMDATGAMVVDSVNWSNSVTSGVVISPLLAEGGCPALMPGGRGGRGGGGRGAAGAVQAGGGQGSPAIPPAGRLSIFRWPNGADTDSNCGDFRVQAATMLPAASPEGATNLKVASTAGFGPGQAIMVDTGANLETAVIASVGSSGASSMSTATSTGATVIPVTSLTGFNASDMITIDSGPNQETSVIVSTTGTLRGQTNITISLATPLKFAHAAGAQVSGTGIFLTAPLARAHPGGAPVTGDLPTPGAPNRYFNPK